MPPLYVLEQGSRISIRKRRISVVKGENKLASLPEVHVSEVLVFGNVGLTTPAIGHLLRKNIPVTFLSMRGEYKGRLIGSLSPHVELRRKQYLRIADPDFSLRLAQAFVDAKLRHMRVRVRRWCAGESEEAESVLRKLKAWLERVPRTTKIASLRGLEGSATAAYFSVYRDQFGSEWRFRRRARRPPPDPVNALLSFGYTLLANAVRGAVEAVGLDPYAGFLHRVAYNRPSLALDIVEEFRPMVDGLVLGWIRRGCVKRQDFQEGPEERPVILEAAALRRFIRAFEKRLEGKIQHPVRSERLTMRRCFLEQARQVAGSIRSGEPNYLDLGFR